MTQTSKTLDDFFADWESETFGYGYGTGEQYTIPALKRFLELCPINPDYPDWGRCYDYKELERELTAAVAWLMINILGASDVIDYGSSPRGAWLTPKGMRLKRFVEKRTIDELYDLANRDEDYTRCGSDYCNCGPHGYEKGRICPNPFFHDDIKP